MVLNRIIDPLHCAFGAGKTSRLICNIRSGEMHNFADECLDASTEVHGAQICTAAVGWWKRKRPHQRLPLTPYSARVISKQRGGHGDVMIQHYGGAIPHTMAS